MYILNREWSIPLKIKRKIVGHIPIGLYSSQEFTPVTIQVNSKTIQIVDPEGFLIHCTFPSTIDNTASAYGFEKNHIITAISMHRMIVPARLFWTYYGELIKTHSIQQIAITIMNAIGAYSAASGSLVVETEGSKYVFSMTDVDPVIKKRGLITYGVSAYTTTDLEYLWF